MSEVAPNSHEGSSEGTKQPPLLPLTTVHWLGPGARIPFAQGLHHLDCHLEHKLQSYVNI